MDQVLEFARENLEKKKKDFGVVRQQNPFLLALVWREYKIKLQDLNLGETEYDRPLVRADLVTWL